MSLDSKQVEERVLKMTFDNDSFEKKTKQSLTTLEKLKSSLDFRGASKGFENIASNTNILSKNINVLNSGVQSIQHEFSSLEVIGATCLVNLTNAAIKAGKNMVNALTLEPVKTGFQEYETKMGSIQTILTNTAKHGTTLNEVIDALDELNLYADKTIYNFQQMTRNVGTFTAAGLDLKTSTDSIQGIANLAAASGSTSQQASTAMYQLSQALSAGTVKLQDWNSVVNAGMGGTLFQDALKETAKEMGTDVDAIVKEAGSFRNSLQKGWITSDVLSTTLRKFTVKGAKEYGEAMLQNGKYTSEANKALMEQAQRMEDAATKVKTFTQLWDTLKETAQSGWGKTWEIIVGDYDKAKEFFTQVNDVISPLLDRMANARNDLLEKALGSPSKWNEIVASFSKAGIGMESIKKAMAETYASKGIISDVKEFDALLEKYGGDYSAMAKGLKEEGKDSFEFINLTREALKQSLRENSKYTESQMSATEKLKKFQKVVNDVWAGDYGNQDPDQRSKALEAEGYEFERVQRLVNLVRDAKSGYALTMEDLTEEDLRSLGLTKAEIEAFKELQEQIKDTDSELNAWIASMQKATGRELLIDSLFNIGRAIKSVVKPIAEAFQSVFAPLTGDDVYAGIEAFNNFTKALILNEEQAKTVKDIFTTLFNVFDSVRLVVSSGLRLGVGIITKLLKSLNIEVGPLFEALANGTGALREWMHENDVVAYILDKIGPGIEWLGEKLTWLFDKIRELPMFQNGITNGIIDLLNEIKTVAGEKFGGFFGKLFGGSSPGEAIAESINPKETASKVTEKLTEIASGIKTGVTGAISENLDAGEGGGTTGEKVKNKITVIFVDFFKNAFSGIGEALKTAFNWLSERIDPSTIIAGGFILTLLKITEKVTSVLFMFEKPLEALAGFFKSWGKVGDSVRKYIDAKKTSLVVNNFLKVTAGLLIMSFAIRNLGKMKASELAKGVGACMVLIMGLQALTYIIMKGIGANPAKIEGAFGLLIGMAAMVGVLSASLASFKDMTMDQIMTAELALVGVMGLVTLFLVVIKKLYTVENEKIDLPGLGAVIFGVSFAIKRMVEATKTAGEMDMGTVKRGLLVVSTMMAMLSLLMKASMSGHRRNFTGSGGLGVTALAAALAVAILVKMVKTAAEVTKEEFKQALKVIGAMMTMVTVVAIISRIGKGGNAGLAILSWMSAFLMIPLVIKEINMLDLHDVDYAFSVMTSIGSMFSFMLIASKAAGKYAVKGAVLITAATMMMALLTPVIALLTMIAENNPEALSKAVRSIAVILGMFGVLTFLSSFAISGDISSAKSVIISAGIIVALLAGVAIALGSIEDDKVVIKGVAAVVAILLAIGFMFWAASKMTFDKDAQRGIDKGAMWSIFAFIGALAVMVGVAITAMGVLNAISPNKDAGNKMLEHVSNTLMVIAAFIFAISVGTAIMMKNAPTQAMSWKGWGQLVLMAASMAALLVGIYAAIKLIDFIPSNGNILDNVVKMGLAIGALVAIVLLAVLITRVAHKMSFAGDPKKLETITKQLLTTCAVMGALLVEAGIIVYAMGNINMPSLNWTSLVQVFAVMLMMCLMGAGLSVIANKLAGTDIKDAANVLVGICIAMGFVAIEAAAVLKGINAMGVEAVDWKVIGNLVAVMIGMSAVAAVLVAIMKYAPTTDLKERMIGTGGMFVVVAAVAWAVSGLIMPALNNVETEGLLPKVGGLIAILAAIAVVAGVMTGVMMVVRTQDLGKIVKGFLAETGMLIVVAKVAKAIAEDIMPALNGVNSEGIFEKSMSLCGILMSLAIVAGIMAAINAIPGITGKDMVIGVGIMALIGVVAQLLGALGGLLVGELAMWFDESGAMDSVLNLTSKLPDLGDDIHKFIEAIDVTSEDDDAINSVKNFVTLLDELAGLTILKEVTDALGVTDDIFESLGTIGESMAGGISAMLEAMNSASLDPDAVQKFADCIKPILGLQLMMYGSGGALQFFLGEKDLAVFGNQLGAFAKGAATLAYYLDNGVTVDGTKYKPNWVNSQSVIKSFCDCIKPITDLQKSLYGYGGKVQWIMGEKDLSLFAEQMVESYPNYAKFASSILKGSRLWAEDTKEVIGNFSYCLTEVAKAAGSIPNEGGKLAEWIGDNKATLFADDLVALADGMYDVNVGINHEGITWDETKFSKFALCLTTIGEAIGNIPTNENGWWNVLTSTLHPNIGNFSNDIVSLSKAMVDMNSALDGKASLFLDGSIVTIFTNLSGALENLPTDDQIYNLSEYALNAASNNFETNLKSLGNAIAGFVGPLTSLNNTNVSSATTSLNLMTDALKNASAIDFANLEKYGGNLTNLGNTTVDGFVEAFEGSYAKCAEGVTNFANTLDSAYKINGVYRMELLGKHIVEDLVNKVKEKMGEVTSVATSICNAMYNTFRDYHDNMYNIGAYLTNGFIQGMNSKVESVKSAADALSDFIGPRLQNNLEEESPSKLTFRIGAYVGEGLANGMMNSLSMVQNASDIMSEESVMAINGALNNMYNSFEQETFNPTITPVLDMSEVQNGFGYINGMLDNSIIGLASRNLDVSADMSNYDVIDTLNSLGESLGTSTVNNYNVNGITYDDGSNVASAVGQLIYAANIARRS